MKNWTLLSIDQAGCNIILNVFHNDVSEDIV